MIISKKLILTAIFLISSFFQGLCANDHKPKSSDNKAEAKLQNVTTLGQLSSHSQQRNQKYSSRIIGDSYASTDRVFGIRTFPVGKTTIDELVRKKPKIPSQTERVLDFRILDTKNKEAQSKIKTKTENVKKNKTVDIATAATGGGKFKKDTTDDEEKTLAQQVADGKYGLIQNELFSNGSKRPGILSYRSNKEVPKDTKENLGGLEKDEIWLAEDHILVLKGGNYQNLKDTDSTSTPVWPPIDDYQAPNRQVKIPSNPEIPPPFPVQLTEDGPIEFIKGKNNPSFLPPVVPSLPSFTPNANKNNSLPFYIPPLPPLSEITNKSFGVPPQVLPPFLSNLPPGATFVAPPDNKTDIDEDDPSIYYPPKYDFIYPQSNTTAVPPGPLVPGIILPPPPDFFSLLEDDKNAEYENDTDDSINSVTPKVFEGPKYLPALRKPSRTRISNKWQKSRQPTTSNTTNFNNSETFKHEKEKPKISYVYPENSLQKLVTTTPSLNSFRTSIKVPTSKYPKGFSSPIYVPNPPNQAIYHPLPTTSPKPNHITLPPTTKALPKQILIITTPESTGKKLKEETPKKPKKEQNVEKINLEIHPLRSLIRPNVTVSYNGKYGHLPSANNFERDKPEDDIKIIRGHYVTLPPPTKTSKVPTTDLNSIIVTPVPIVKKVRVQTITPEKEKVETTPVNPSKATLYFYEEPTTVSNDPTTKPVQSFVETQANKNQANPANTYYYTTKTPLKTPVRQFLEETFHSSNVLSRKPQIGHINNAEIITHSGFSDTPKMKHLNYGIQISSPRPTIKYHYVTEGNTVLIPSPKVKDLEIKNSGSSGLQTVHLDAVSVRPTLKPIVAESFLESTQKPEAQKPIHVANIETSKPETGFIPINYYATSRPEDIHFTSQEQTFVDDITKNYFTIFGQKINLPSTTPLTPIKVEARKNKTQESGLTYISNDGHNFKIQQVHDTSLRNPGKSISNSYSENVKHQSTQPPSNFEKYLKELTGEDQRDYIVSGVFPAKIKKGKVLIGSTGERIPSHLLEQNSFVIHKSPIPDSGVSRPKYFYQPQLYTTLRPVVDVEIKPHYIKHTSSTAQPLNVYQPQILPQNVHLNHNIQQYHQEITGFTSPTTSRPIKIKKPNGQLFESPSPIVYPEHESRSKPISLEGDILVNYKLPRPNIEPQAELINIQPPYDNIKIVKSPDLSQKPNQPYSAKQIPFGVAKDFFQNLPQSGYFNQPQQTGGNSFVSYNLPGNGGHFYFLTPQIIEEKLPQDQVQDNRLRRINRSDRKIIQRNAGTADVDYTQEIEQHNLNVKYLNSDYLRRRRKKS